MRSKKSEISKNSRYSGKIVHFFKAILNDLICFSRFFRDFITNFFQDLKRRSSISPLLTPDLFRKSFFKEKSCQVTQKSSHDFDFFQKIKKFKVMT
jgi:hypothetical protein